MKYTHKQINLAVDYYFDIIKDSKHTKLTQNELLKLTRERCRDKGYTPNLSTLRHWLGMK